MQNIKKTHLLTVLALAGVMGLSGCYTRSRLLNEKQESWDKAYLIGIAECDDKVKRTHFSLSGQIRVLEAEIKSLKAENAEIRRRLLAGDGYPSK
jgi:hypothetical protein